MPPARASLLAVLFLVACPKPKEAATASAEYDCPPPVGRIVREDCTAVGKQHEVTFDAGDVAARAQLVNEANLVVSIAKERRAQLCNDHNACKLPPPEYRAEKKKLDDAHLALVALKPRIESADQATAPAVLADLAAVRQSICPTCSGAPKPAGLADGLYTIQSKQTSKCLDVPANDATSGLVIEQYGCHSGANQLWKLKGRGDGIVSIASVGTSLCLDIPYAKAEEGLKLQQYQCHGGDNQQWRLQSEDDGTYRIVSLATKLCLDVPNGALEDKVQIIQWGCHGGENQRWYVTRVGD